MEFIVSTRTGNLFRGGVKGFLSIVTNLPSIQVELARINNQTISTSPESMIALPGMPSMSASDFMDLIMVATSVGMVMPEGYASITQLLRGQAFERNVLSELGLSKNVSKIGSSIPDSLTGGRITEIKDVQYLYVNSQMRDYINAKVPIDLVVSPQTVISQQLRDAIRASGGSIWVRVGTGQYIPFVPK